MSAQLLESPEATGSQTQRLPRVQSELRSLGNPVRPALKKCVYNMLSPQETPLKTSLIPLLTVRWLCPDTQLLSLQEERDSLRLLVEMLRGLQVHSFKGRKQARATKWISSSPFLSFLITTASSVRHPGHPRPVNTCPSADSFVLHLHPAPAQFCNFEPGPPGGGGVPWWPKRKNTR